MSPTPPPLNFRIGSLFSGIGGLELGLERAGLGHTVWQVERDPACRAVLAHHWPTAARFDDVTDVGRGPGLAELPPCDVIAAGFPCQDLSVAGRGAGLGGARSGLFFEVVRLVRDLQPDLLVLENVSGLLVRGLDVVLGELADCGLDAAWSSLRAADVGAPHLRERIFIVAWVADPAGRRRPAHELGPAPTGGPEPRRRGALVGDAAGQRHPLGARLRGHLHQEQPAAGRAGGVRHRPGRAPEPRVAGGLDGMTWPAPRDAAPHAWEPPRMRPRRPGDEDRVRALGNAVVPQQAEVVGIFARHIFETMVRGQGG